MDEQQALAALGEPRRLQIVRLLAAAPRTVGEIATLLGALQPQTTKHLQALESAGLVTIHRLGRRRVAALRREQVRELADWLGTLAVAHPSESVLEQYQRAIETEEARVAAGEHATTVSVAVVTVPATLADVWRAWTTEAVVRRWWAPEHFEVDGCTVEPVVGGRIEVVLRERDGTLHTARGTVHALDPLRMLTFELSPVAPDGSKLFTAVQEVSLRSDVSGTAVSLTAHVSDVTAASAAVAAGVRLGWEQSLDKLRRLLAASDRG